MWDNASRMSFNPYHVSDHAAKVWSLPAEGFSLTRVAPELFEISSARSIKTREGRRLFSACIRVKASLVDSTTGPVRVRGKAEEDQSQSCGKKGHGDVSGKVLGVLPEPGAA